MARTFRVRVRSVLSMRAVAPIRPETAAPCVRRQAARRAAPAAPRPTAIQGVEMKVLENRAEAERSVSDEVATVHMNTTDHNARK